MNIQERFANPEGRSCIKYFQDGTKIVTGGPDGDVHIFGSADEAADDSDYEPFYAGDEILGLAVAKNHQVFIAPKMDPVGSNEVLAVSFEGRDLPIPVFVYSKFFWSKLHCNTIFFRNALHSTPQIIGVTFTPQYTLECLSTLLCFIKLLDFVFLNSQLP